MNYETALKLGLDLIAPAVFLFTFFYGAFVPWWRSRLGWAMFLHGLGSTLLFGPIVLTQHGFLPENFVGSNAILVLIVILWIAGWWLLAYAVVWPILLQWFGVHDRRAEGVR